MTHFDLGTMISEIWKMSLVIWCQTIDHFQLQTNCNECISNADHRNLELLYFLCSFDDIFQNVNLRALNMFYLSRTTFQKILQLIISKPCWRFTFSDHQPKFKSPDKTNCNENYFQWIRKQKVERKAPKERNEADRNKTLINTKVRRQSAIIILIDFIERKRRRISENKKERVPTTK